MKTVVIMPGGFHPFHAGHLALYNQAVEAFPGADVYVAATDDTSKRPFPFAVKEKLAQLAGVPAGRFVKVKSPFSADEITSKYDLDNTVVVFVRSEKDRAAKPQPGGVKRDGTPSKLQPLDDNPAPASQHTYMTYLPTVEFGPGMTSATEIRDAWPKLNDRRKTALVMSLYPRTQNNPALAKNVVAMLDSAIIGSGSVTEGGDADYIEEKWSQKYKDSINCSNPKGFSQRAHCAGRKKKVNESSGYSLKGSFTPDLIRSKVWLIKELAQISPTIQTIYILGSWYGNLSLYMNLLNDIKFNNIINVEQDQSMLDQSARMLDHIGTDRVDHMLADANDLDYRQLGPAGAVINTSLTDMDGTDWYRHIPDGTLVVMQARDRDPGYQFHSPRDILKKFPMDQVLYSGTMELQDPETRYQRFMVIGRK
jgi:hypothetical protein